MLINQYLEINRKVESLPPDSALKLLDAAQVLAGKHKLAPRTGHIWCLKAFVLIRLGNFDDVNATWTLHYGKAND